MSDLISRSKAIRWVKAECNPYGQPTLDYESGIKVIEHLERMPSAQPEQIIRCTNCRFFKRNIPCTGGHYNGCEMWLDDGNEIRVMTDDYCSKALPKEGEEDEID